MIRVRLSSAEQQSAHQRNLKSAEQDMGDVILNGKEEIIALSVDFKSVSKMVWILA